MLILLPPSEGKFRPSRGRPLDLQDLSFPELDLARKQILGALTELCHDDPDSARAALGLPAGLTAEVARNAALLTAPTTTVARVYTGVLYDALGLDTLTPAAKRRAASRLLVTSAAFGLLRPGDRIPAYRLSGSVNLPCIGPVASAWRAPLDCVLGPLASRHLLLDLRSGTYAAFWRPGRDQARRVLSVRVVVDHEGRRTVVSHDNKATKGRLVRDLLEDGANPQSQRGVLALLRELGWRAEPTPGVANSIDVVHGCSPSVNAEPPGKM